MSIAEKLTTIAENEQKVYEKGKESERRAWWSAVTANYTRTSYRLTFRDYNFSEVGGFNPPKTLKANQAGYMFHRSRGIPKITKEQIDFSDVTDADYVFASSDVQEIEEVYCARELINTFSTTHLIRIGKLVIKQGAVFGRYPFQNCKRLTQIDEIEGVIPNSVSFKWSSELTAKTIKNIVSALSNNATGQTLTFNATAKATYYSAHPDEYADAETAWAALVATKPNWTIALLS